MTLLSNLKNTHSVRKNVQRVGRGIGSKRGKTSCRGHKGAKSRSGYKRRLGNEGGQLPLYRKIPCRGFSNARFEMDVYSINLGRLNSLFAEGETVSRETLIQKGILPLTCKSEVKVLAGGKLTKSLKFDVKFMSASAKQILNLA
ncbi:MAG: 50S ribosomal protein L15 [Chlamydiae bacterium]|jgi:large subunit ribosomal protein L15|nr:50S ribosomal protein L15 [Chlamydiota bacterium]